MTQTKTEKKNPLVSVLAVLIAAVIGFVGKNNAMNDSAAFSAQVKELTEQTETLQADVDEKAASLEEVQAKLTEAEAQVETLTKENETAAADKDQLTKDLEDVKASLEKALADAEAAATQAKADLEAAKAAGDDALAKAKEDAAAAAKAAEDETAVLQAQIDELTKKLADAQKTNP